ncbi:hypothetical protein [Streptomyces sp. NBC_00989]|uniref:hypothetical protein n=1 Tax=Streptomyces sp. NBC_00989 TaxID=2903705 RepID=UPI0038674972|nr:hypothetical protein OG714_36550 [Streptomyces sp. NBC_00989]
MSPAISVGSVEVDVLPNATGVRQRLQNQLVPAANSVGDEVGRVIGRYIAAGAAQGLADGITRGGRQAQPAAIRQGQSTGSAFARSFKTQVQAALANLPDIHLNANSTDAEREIYNIRRQLESIRDARIGIDISSADATAIIDRLQERLTRLSSESPNVQIRVDAGAASAQLAAFQGEVNRLDGQTADVDVDTHAATANLNALTAAAITFGPALLPVLPVVAAGLGAIAAAAVAAGAGLGGIALVAVPAFKQIGGVLQLQKAAQDAATSSTNSGASAAAAASSKALQLAGAQQAVATAERNGARQIEQAQQAVTQARRNAAQVAAQASLSNQQAARAVEDAERSLATAQKTARQAQLDLTAARKQAAQELEDLNNQLVDSALAQRDADLQVKEARQNLNATLADPKATALQRAQAQLAYDEAVQHLKEQQAATRRLKTETAAANKAGVNGSKTVKTAQDQLATAQQAVADKTRSLSDAQAAQARTATQNAQQIADAQQKIADAQGNVAVAQQSAADSAASAQRQLQQAMQSTAGGTDAAATAQAKYQAALAKLTPAARGTYFAFLNLRTAFSAWSRALQPAVMPIFTRALDAIRRALPQVTPFVLAAASAIGKLQDRASRGFKNPWWKTFRKDLQGSVEPAIIGLGVAFGNVFVGMAGIIGAFLPHMASISDTLQRITGKFANWGKGLKGSPTFERFLSYSADKAPLIGDTLGKIANAFIDIGRALSPVSGPLLQVIGGLAQGVGWLAKNVPGLVIGLYGLYVATKLWALWQGAVNLAMAAFDLIAAAGPWGWIVLAIAAVVLAVIYAYKHFTWFRDGVQAVWTAIKVASMWLWTNVLQPVFNAIWTALQTVGRWASWLWTHAIKPAWDAISLAAKILVTAIVVLAILPIIAAIKILGAIGSWLWTHVFSPVFGWIGAKAKWLYANAIKPAWDNIVSASKSLWNNYLKPAFTSIWGGLQTVGKWATWLYKNAIKPAWDNIVSVIKTAYRVGIKPVFDAFHLILKGLGGWFQTAVGAIKSQWDKLKAVAKAPVQFVVDTVYNNGIRGVWNKVADAFGAPPLKAFKFAQGGVMPGYTPGKDVHKFVSPTGGRLELSGGEAIMRPEFTRAVGSGFVGSMNAIAKSQGSQGVKAALAPVFGGNPMAATDRTLRYKDGGIFGWIGSAASKAAGAGSAVWNGIKKGASWLGDTLESSARAGVKNVVNPLLKNFPGMDTGFGKLVRHIPNKIIDTLFGYSKDADKKGGGGIGGPKIQAALNWAKSQAGKPYIWGGVGPKGFDCSGFMGAIENELRGQKPNSRRWATGAFSGKTAPPGWVYHGNSPFRIGITNAGVGHTAGTLGKTNVESRGGTGVIVGSAARGYNNSLFPSWYGFQPGKYDQGGYLQPGMNLAYNGTGKPEPVFTSQQASALTAPGRQPQEPIRIELHPQEGAFGHWVDVRIQDSQQQLVQVLNAG